MESKMHKWILLWLVSLVFLPGFAAAQQIGSANYNLLALSGADNGCSGNDCVAVVLIHGIHGTSNYDSSCSLTNSASNDCYWEPLIDHFRSSPSIWSKIRIYVFRYISDTADVSTVEIGNALRSMIDTPPSSCADCQEIKRPFIIVAHSMGGIVARQFMNSKPSNGLQRGSEFVLGVITLATPHHGSPLANRVMRDNKAENLAGQNKNSSGCVNAKWGTWYGAAGEFDCLDSLFWDTSNHSPQLVSNADLPNRSDLLWDEYNDYFTDQRAQIGTELEINQTLKTLAGNSNALIQNDSRKMILYGSSVDTDKRASSYAEVVYWDNLFDKGSLNHDFLVHTAELANEDLKIYQTDGMVPLESAMKSGDTLISFRRYDLYDYDHQDMRGNSFDDKRVSKNFDLFNRISIDIDALIRFRAIPPRFLRLDVSPASAGPGSTVALTGQVRNSNAKSTPVILKAIVSGPQNQIQCSYASATVGIGDSFIGTPEKPWTPALSR
jgi:hypothetical protein